MTVADGSQVRLAYVPEVTIGTTPATPAFQTMRYVTSDIGVDKQVDIPNEVDPTGNVQSITDVGRSIKGTINTLFSYGGQNDKFLEMLLRGTWSSNVLVNGITPATISLEEFYEQGTTDSYIRYRGVRINTLDLNIEARKSVEANWGIMGIDSPTPTSAIISGATYTGPTTTDVFNGGLNVASFAITGITNSPKIKKLSMKVNSNIYQNDIVGQYAPYSHGLGREEVTGSISCLFENIDAYNAVLNHTTVAMAFTLTDSTPSSYAFSLPKVKFLNGKPSKPGNGQAVMVDIPFQAYKDSGIGGSIQITRTP